MLPPMRCFFIFCMACPFSSRNGFACWSSTYHGWTIRWIYDFLLKSKKASLGWSLYENQKSTSKRKQGKIRCRPWLPQHLYETRYSIDWLRILLTKVRGRQRRLKASIWTHNLNTRPWQTHHTCFRCAHSELNQTFQCGLSPLLLHRCDRARENLTLAGIEIPIWPSNGTNTGKGIIILL